ncbi:hypothetical protein [Exiguobacterium artemiae]|uniref:hypothetical protein n=1 Tax=Exiguobacterium artemiae TaxID=340145 RepID=UPI001F25DE58|nr:hypothetical protein [Exiguobacterium sibiricum]
MSDEEQKGLTQKGTTLSFTHFPQARHKPAFLPYPGREAGLVSQAGLRFFL